MSQPSTATSFCLSWPRLRKTVVTSCFARGLAACFSTVPGLQSRWQTRKELKHETVLVSSPPLHPAIGTRSNRYLGGGKMRRPLRGPVPRTTRADRCSDRRRVTMESACAFEQRSDGIDAAHASYSKPVRGLSAH